MFRALLHYLATLLDPPTPPNASTAAPQAHPPAARQTSRRATVTTEDDGAPLLMRRDVLDAEMNVAAYAFALRGEPRDKLRGVSAQMRDFLDELLLEQMAQLDTTALGERRCYAQVWESSLAKLDPQALPPHCGLLVVPTRADRPAEPTLLQRMASLRTAGVELWLDDCAGTPWFDSAAPHASGVVVRMAMRLPTEIADLLKRLRRDGLQRAAWDIASQEEFELARSLGCSRFQGGFVTRRSDAGGRELTPQVLAVAKLITDLRQGADMREMAKVLKQDMAMSYRLLRYVNTAARGLERQLSSIEQALMVLGEEQLDRWLTLLMLGGNLGGNAALMEAALVRARFLELLGEGRLPEAQCERLFVLGLFSMLDVALRIPLEQALEPLNLPEDMRMALLRQKGPFGAYLALAEAVERGQVERVLKHAVAVGLSTRKVNARHLAALAWVNTAEGTPVRGH